MMDEFLALNYSGKERNDHGVAEQDAVGKIVSIKKGQKYDKSGL